MQESQAEGPARAKGQRTAATVCKASCEPAPLRTEEEDPRRAPRSEDQRKQHWVTPCPDRGDQEKRGLVTQARAPQARPQPSCLSVNKFVQRSLRPRGPEPRRPRAQTAFVQAVKGLFIPALASRPLNPACSPCPRSCGHRRPVGRAAARPGPQPQGHSFLACALQDPLPTEQRAGGCRLPGLACASQKGRKRDSWPEPRDARVGLACLLLLGDMEGGEAR